MRRQQNNDIFMRLQDLMRPKKRLQTLFMFHALGSFFVGGIGFVFPWMWGLFFTDGGVSDGVHEHQGAASVAHVMIRLYCALVVAQGWIILHLTDATAVVKKTVIQSYFGCFGASLCALILAHMSNDGSLSGGFFGIVKFLAFLSLTVGYGWFALFQPPEVFNVLGNSL
jgi:hypothetical protein